LPLEEAAGMPAAETIGGIGSIAFAVGGDDKGDVESGVAAQLASKATAIDRKAVQIGTKNSPCSLVYILTTARALFAADWSRVPPTRSAIFNRGQDIAMAEASHLKTVGLLPKQPSVCPSTCSYMDPRLAHLPAPNKDCCST
jgi:hypothetical protein